MISAMHTSVSTHLSYNFIDFEKDKTYPNLEMY